MIQVRINNYKFYREHVILLLIKGSYFKVGRLKVKGKIYWIVENFRSVGCTEQNVIRVPLKWPTLPNKCPRVSVKKSNKRPERLFGHLR